MLQILFVLVFMWAFGSKLVHTQQQTNKQRKKEKEFSGNRTRLTKYRRLSHYSSRDDHGGLDDDFGGCDYCDCYDGLGWTPVSDVALFWRDWIASV